MPTLHWIGKDKVINHHLDVPYKVLEHQYGFGLAEPSEFGEVGLTDSRDLEADKIQQSTNPKNPNSDNHSSEFGEVGLTDSRDLEAAEIQQSTNPKNPDSDNHPNNKIIHGDNLEALKSLLPEYEGKIKCIYIDPPYNTGNESWVYNDNVNDPKIKKWLGNVVGKEAEDLTRHDKWLCMMYPRLKLLHKLLADDGAIFISIDDNEVNNLRLALNEIFSSNFFITQLIWKSRKSEDARAKTGVSNDHEYILCYGKSSQVKFFGVDKDLTKFSNPDNDVRGAWRSADLTGLATKDQRPNLHYDLIDPDTSIKFSSPNKGWRFDIKTMTKRMSEGRIIFPKNPEGRPRQKMFMDEMASTTKTLSSVITDFNTGDGTKEINSLLGSGIFDFPKPSSLIKFLIEQITDKNSIILDSFAGSGTTAHAVLNLNKQDGGNRKFILIEMEAYAETITAERVKRVMNGYGNTEGTGGSFDFYTLGEPLFLEDGLLNENLPLQKIRAYIWYTETQSALQTSSSENTEVAAFLGKNQNTAYYFYYLPQEITTLDHDFLASIKTKAEQYIIYADNCLLTPNYMAKNSIVFKKIPRDVTRF